jgi:hypothetical protein
VLYNVYDESKTCVKIVLEAVTQNSLALLYAFLELRNNIDIVFAAAIQNGLALQYTSVVLKNQRSCFDSYYK